MSRASLLIALGVCLALPVRAQQSGVLLGIAGASTSAETETQDFATIHAPSYKTFWIARDRSGKLGVLATFPELVVPRRNGFWHAGVAQVCEFADNNESLRQVVWAAPVAQPGEVDQRNGPCTEHKPEDYAPLFGRSEADSGKISQCGFELVNILYLSPELISSSTYSGQSEDCEARGGRYMLDFSVRRLNSAEPVRFADLLGAKAKLAYAAALPKQGRDDGGEECGESLENDDSGWRVEHKRGRWRPYLHQDLGYFGCSVDAPVAVALPGALTGDAPAVPDWKALQDKLPGAADVFVSPAGDLLVASSHSEICFYELRSGVPGKVLLKLPAAGVVMVQWATGSHVHDWTEQLGKLAAQHPPKPVVRVKPSNQ